MGGTSSSTSNTQQQSQLSPYAPAASDLQGILGSLSPSISNINGTPDINQAYAQLESNAQAPNQFAAPAGAATLSQLQGGPNFSGATNTVNNGYNATTAALSPFTTGSSLNPSTNPALASELGTVAQQTQNTVNPVFSAAGRLGSPADAQALATGIAQGDTGIFQNAASNQINAAGTQSTAANNAGGILGNLDVGNAGIQTQGVNNAPNAYTMPSLGPEELLAAATQQQQQPIQTASALSGILGPIASQFGTQTGSGSTSGTQTMSPMQQALMATQMFSNIFGGQGGGSASNASKLIFS